MKMSGKQTLHSRVLSTLHGYDFIDLFKKAIKFDELFASDMRRYNPGVIPCKKTNLIKSQTTLMEKQSTNP